MAEKEIALLKEQTEKLNDKKFDLDAWKNHTIIFLERIFGKDNSKIKMIKELHYDYSSWSLRDTAAAGKTKDKDPVRLQAEEILQAAIAELELLGLPEEKRVHEKLWEILSDELTGRQLKEIESLISSEDAQKSDKITAILNKLEKENLVTTVTKLLLS